jgi:hypothetical protein
MEYVTGYLAGVVGTLIFAALKTPYNELRPVTIISLLWPVMLPAILLSLILDLFGITFDLNEGKTQFGFRKSPNPEIAGFGVTAFGLELQFYKVRKA